MEKIAVFFVVYFVIVSLISAVFCVYDKAQSKKGGRRISEAALLWLSFLGGAAVMLFTMKTVRHKTRHNKFMIGLPMMIVFHIAVAVLLVLNLDKGVI